MEWIQIAIKLSELSNNGDAASIERREGVVIDQRMESKPPTDYTLLEKTPASRLNKLT